MTSRSKHRLDYLVFSETGRKENKGLTKMDKPEVRESQLVGDIKHSLELFGLNDLESQDEI